MKLDFLRSPIATLALFILVLATSHTQIVQAVDSVIDGNLVFTGPGQGGAKDIRTSNTEGGLRIFNGQTLSPIPEGAAIQFFGNGSNSFPGQAFIDSGAHNNAALIFRTAGTGQGITERMRVTAAGNVGIGTNNPQDQLELTGNLRLPNSTATTGIIRSGTNTLLHTFGTSNFFAGIRAGNLTMTGSANTGIGTQALLNTTTGSSNTAIGNLAMQATTTGTGNTATGTFALQATTTGNSNTATGAAALLVNTTGANNTAVGEQAGTTNDTGSNNTFIGKLADGSTGNLTNAAAIGANAKVGASNSLVLGDTGANAVNVGIGTTTPRSTLQVVGNYIQIPTTFTVLPPTDCDEVAEVGRVIMVTGGSTVLWGCALIDSSTSTTQWLPL